MLLLTIISLSVMETPYFFIERGDLGKAARNLKLLRGRDYARVEIEDLSSRPMMRNVKLAFEVMRRSMVGPVIIVNTVEVMNEKLMGLDAIISYAPFFFQSSGYTNHQAFMAAAFVAALQMASKVASGCIIRYCGRRRMFIQYCGRREMLILAHRSKIIPVVCVTFPLIVCNLVSIYFSYQSIHNHESYDGLKCFYSKTLVDSVVLCVPHKSQFTLSHKKEGSDKSHSSHISMYTFFVMGFCHLSAAGSG